MEKVFVDKCNNHVAVLTINNPPANVLSRTVLQELSDTLDILETDQSIKAIVLRGEGSFFSAGADVKEFTSLQKEADYSALAQHGQALFDRIENLSTPVIASIHGAALGGGLELALACHIRYVADDSKLGLPELTIGIIPGFAGTQRLPQFVGMAKAYEMILSGTSVSGKQAVTLGLANAVFAEEELFDKTTELASNIAAKSGPAIKHIMHLILHAKNSQFQQGIKEEAKAFGEVFGNTDAKEGIQAFIEKRKPRFQDR